MKAKKRVLDFSERHLKVVPEDDVEGAAKTAERTALLDRLFTARDLGQRDHAPMEYLVPDLLPEGVGMFPGAPKSGKSFVMLDLALSVATGGRAFGRVRVDRRPVLYLALEDGERRLKGRMRGMGYDAGPANLWLLTEADPEEVLPLVEGWLDRNPRGLVLVDVLAKATPGTPKRGESEYQFYYRVLGEYKRLAHAHPGCGIVIAHHTKKRGRDGGNPDFIEDALGSTALTGAVDYNLTLFSRRGEDRGKLMMTGKDTRDYAVALVRQGSGAWWLDGGTFEEARGNVIMTPPDHAGRPLKDSTISILQMAQRPGGVSVAEVVDEIDAYADNAGAARVLLNRLKKAGKVKSDSRGRFVAVEQP